MLDYWVLDVPDEHETRYLLCCEHLEPVPDRKEELIERRRLDTEFEMKDLDMMHYFLGMEVWHNVDGIFLG